MCGILGNFGFIERDVFASHIKTVSDLLTRRGPDQTRSIDLDNFMAVHSRLIVQGDWKDGVQPMRYNNLALLFNGNIYNKCSLKTELEREGYRFNGISDTEVVAVSIFHWGTKAFEKFNGFFSIACFYLDKKTLLLARDRFGQKPLYYSKNHRSVFFGSTESLVPRQFIGRERKESIIDFITYGFVPSPNTMYENLYSVSPGSFIEFSFANDRCSILSSSTYWEPVLCNEIQNYEDAVELISESISRSIREGIDASIDVACLFSGGVDSSLMLSNAKMIKPNICAITADFGEGDDAGSRSRSLAQVLGHKNHIVRDILQTDVAGSLAVTSKICESPFDDTSIIPSNVVFATVKEAGYSVALTGDGADELFCGYPSFSKLSKLEYILGKKFDFMRQQPNKIVKNLITNYSSIDLSRFFMSESELLADLSCNGFKKREWGAAIDTDYDPLHYLTSYLDNLKGMRPLDKFRLLNLKFKLPFQMLYKVDRASMFNSVEARPLFLNNHIVDSALLVSSDLMLKNGPKSVLKSIYKRQMSHSGWSLPKTGFGWRTESYNHLFKQQDYEFLKSETGVDGWILLKNKKKMHKRGFYGLFSLVSWLRVHQFENNI